MGLEIKQYLKLSQQLVMTPQLQQAIKLLQLSRLELVDTINQELLENPLLDETEETAPDEELAQMEREAGLESTEIELDAPSPAEEAAPETAGSDGEAPAADEVKIEENVKEDFDWENYLGEYSSAPVSGDGSMYEERETPSYESVLSKDISLKDHLLDQLRLSRLDEQQMRVGVYIACNLTPEGYLAISLEDLAEAAEVSEKQAEYVLKQVQRLDPLGVAARDLRECLLVQAWELYPAQELVHDIIENHLHDLERGSYQAIAKKLEVSLDEVAEAIGIIKRLEPKPGRAISEEEPIYITPDIYVDKVDGKYVIILNEDGLPKLRVNSFYKEAVATGASPEAKEYVQNKLRGALWLIRSIHQRQRTIYKVTESIVKHQKDFLDNGIALLKPMVLRDVAEDVGMHESTISRVTTNKYVHTPQGVFELKFFFNSSINRVAGGAVASEAVKDRIRKVIAQEDPSKPFSDQSIADMLKQENIDIARRTVAKYREMLGILPSSRRRQPLLRAGK